jgi:hypothetical protein
VPATPDRFLDLSAFQAPCTPNGEGSCAGGRHFGNLGRNAFDGPGYRNVDLTLVKNTRLGGRLRLQLRVDVFNVLNHPNFANPLLPSYAVDFLHNGIDPATNRGVGFLPLTATVDVGGGNPFLGGGGPARSSSPRGFRSSRAARYDPKRLCARLSEFSSLLCPRGSSTKP